MGIFNLFKRRPEKPATANAEQPTANAVEPVKAQRDYKSAPGHYVPRADYVRITNIARAVGISATIATKMAFDSGITVYWKNKKHYVRKSDALGIHERLWALKKENTNEKA